ARFQGAVDDLRVAVPELDQAVDALGARLDAAIVAEGRSLVDRLNEAVRVRDEALDRRAALAEKLRVLRVELEHELTTFRSAWDVARLDPMVVLPDLGDDTDA